MDRRRRRTAAPEGERVSVLTEVRACRRLLYVLIGLQAQRVLTSEQLQDHVAVRETAHAVRSAVVWFF